ncbi:hypothetical protein WOLCODRAFT_104274 [Wolfiporia cocos MD-104 SS10]|uniref:DUF7082 domain-containing protein n=1 Tax=Wolfiporia cocos (strain MD-104) TaxID=742152 RepID=A0A2H3JNS9_WOLCO|nr:hypothetical protein WOLCODRAFT_104274 [Wolfiporia cocos MD-104 SS10]
MVAMACVSHHPTLDGPISQDYTVPFSNTYYHDVAGGMSSMTRSPPHAPVRYGLTRDAPPTFVLSARESLRVFGYHPFQGTPGTVITVTLTLSLRTTEMIYMRLVLGRTALSTAVRKLANGGYELQAAVPADGYAPETSTVSLSAQALNSSNEVLDSVTFGNFTCIHIAPNSCSVKTFANGPSVDDMLEYTAVPMLRQHPHSASLPPSAFPHAYGSRIAATRPTKPRPPKKQMLMRTRRNGEDESEFPCATLELETSPEDLARGWDEEEMSAGRRLVRFTRVRVGTALRVSCAAVSQADYVEGDTVVSCIYRPDTDTCCVTSVDIIFLLERLVGQEFDIEEKNRIRRNLEGFRPKTVSKNRPDSSAFFLRIMNFPPPKPRNIEKDLKVFDWTILPQALDKIISRYVSCLGTLQYRPT